MSYTKQFMEENPGMNFDGSPIDERPTPQEEAESWEIYEVDKSFMTLFEKTELLKQNIKDQVLSGYMNPLEFYRFAKVITEALDDLKKDPDIFDAASTERAKYGKDKAIINGVVFDVSQRATPDYKTCGDPVYNRLKEELSAREKLLKNLPSEGMADPETGEIIKPPVINISQFVTVKI